MPRPLLLRALPAATALTLWLSPGAVRAEAVFVGAAARSASGEGLASRIGDALGKAFAFEGATDLTQDPAAMGAAQGRVEDLERLLGDARGRYLEGDFKGAIAQTSEGLRRFEEGFAYSGDEKGWRAWTELMLVRALAEGRLGAKDRADRTLAQIAAARPDYVPDPGLAPPKVASRYQAIKKRLKERTVSLEVTSRPAGAEIVIDGRSVGLTPQELTGLLPGRHWVSLRLGDQRYDQRVFLKEGNKGLATTLSDPRRAPAEALRTALARGLSEAELVRLGGDVGDDTLVALVEPAAAEVRVLVGRVRGDGLVSVTALAVRDDLSDLDDAATLLASAALAAEGDSFAAGSGDKSDLRRRFLGARVPAPAADEDDGGSLAWLVTGTVVAGVVAAGAAAALAAVLLNQPPNPGGTDLVIDASSL